MSYLPFPSGTVLDFAGTTAPQGWLLCQGQAVSRSIYASLFSAIGTTWGSGDGSTTFNLPDNRGIFRKGVGSQTIGAVTYTGVLATKENDAIQGHKHADSGHTHTGTVTANPPAGTTTGGGQIAVNGGPLTNPVTIQNGTANLGDPTATTYGTPRIAAQTIVANAGYNTIIKI